MLQAAYSFIKKRLWHKYFPVNFEKFLRVFFLTEDLRWLLLLLHFLSSLLDTLSKYPGGYLILQRGLKLNSKILVVKYKKIKFTRVSWFSTGELSKSYLLKMQKLHKTYSYFGQTPNQKGSISPSNFDVQMPNIVFICGYFYVFVFDVICVMNRRVVSVA